METNLAGLYIQIEAKKRRIMKIIVNNVPKWAITSGLVILRATLFADRRIYGFVGGTENLGGRGGVGKLQRSFVGSPRLRRGLRCLRMTNEKSD
jgi:hypothetical protein